MRAVVIERFGEADGLVLADLPEPEAGPGQLLIEAEAVGVAGVDAVIRRGTVGGIERRAGMVPGSEVAGIVTAVGAGVDAPAWTGRRVWASTGTSGAYAERVVAHVDDVLPLPPGLEPVAAVTLGSAVPVAHFALEHAHLATGDRLLVRGAAGSIGIAAVQLAVRAGADVVAVTTSSADRGARLRALGATHVLDRDGDGATAPAEFDVVLDVVGGPDLPAFVERLASNGRMVLVGAVAGLPPVDFGARLLTTFQRSRSFATFSLATVPAAARDAVRADAFVRAARGDLEAVVHAVLPLERAAQAHRWMDEGAVFGRVVLTP